MPQLQPRRSRRSAGSQLKPTSPSSLLLSDVHQVKALRWHRRQSEQTGGRIEFTVSCITRLDQEELEECKITEEEFEQEDGNSEETTQSIELKKRLTGCRVERRGFRRSRCRSYYCDYR